MSEHIWEPLAEVQLSLLGCSSEEDIFCLCSRVFIRHGCICDFIMGHKLEQRVNIEVCVLLGKSETEAFQMMQQAYSNEVISRPLCFEWHSHFRSDRTTDNPGNGGSETETLQEPAPLKIKPTESPLKTLVKHDEEALSCYCSASHTDNNYSTDEHDSILCSGSGLHLSDSGADLSEHGGTGREAEWEHFWASNGERLIWESWIGKYGQYINPDYLAQTEVGATRSDQQPQINCVQPYEQFTSDTVNSQEELLKLNDVASEELAQMNYKSNIDSLPNVQKQAAFPKEVNNLPCIPDLLIDNSDRKTEMCPDTNALPKVDILGTVNDSSVVCNVQARNSSALDTITKSRPLYLSCFETSPVDSEQECLINSESSSSGQLSPASSQASSQNSVGDFFVARSRCDSNTGSIANTTVTTDSMTNVTRITVSSLDLSCDTDSMNSVGLLSASEGTSDGSVESGCEAVDTIELDIYWQDLWKKHFQEQYHEHYYAFLAQVDGPKAKTLQSKTKDTSEVHVKECSTEDYNHFPNTTSSNDDAQGSEDTDSCTYYDGFKKTDIKSLCGQNSQVFNGNSENTCFQTLDLTGSYSKESNSPNINSNVNNLTQEDLNRDKFADSKINFSDNPLQGQQLSKCEHVIQN
ncbi:unnamed protein product, partial [Timema podura]|nr:unnamed protein product [Timema podura]